MTTAATKSQEVAADVAALLRARNPLIWIVTREEARVEKYLFEAAASARYVPHTWDVAQGFCSLAGSPEGTPNDAKVDPGDALDLIRERSENETRPERGLWIMRDLPKWLDGPSGATPQRKLRNLARSLPGIPREQAQGVIVLSPTSEVPTELAGHATVIEWPLPDRAEIAGILDAAIASLPDNLQKDAAPNGTRDAAIDAAVGLNGEEAQACYARSLVQFRKIDPATVAKEKRRVIAREKVLEYFEPIVGGLDVVGGLDNLKAWLLQRKLAYTKEARAYGLRSPRGALLVGVSGCGKTLTAKACAAAWEVPLLRLDLGALKSKFVGDSEANLRKAFRVIEALGRCVVWIDEIEKAMQGATSGSADGGVSSDALGAILSWMQERAGEAFVFATANDVSSLPPELLRKGRFDEIWWVDLPTAKERAAILTAALRANGRSGDAAYLPQVVAACDSFTGAEMAAIVPEAMFAAFADGGREITGDDLLKAASTVVPLATTAGEKIDALRKWAAGRARPATVIEPGEQVQPRVRKLDL